MESERKRTNDIVADMTRQYKSTEEELLQKDGELMKRIELNDQDITELTKEKEEIEKDTKLKLEEKAKELANLNSMMQKMAIEFSQMLKDTLKKMREKIEAANQTWEEENDDKTL